MFVLSNMSDIGETIGKIGEKLIPNLLSFVVQFLSFLVLLLVVIIFAYKPVKKILKKRADYVENEIKEAHENNLIAQKSIDEAKEMVVQSKVQASEIIKNAEKKGQEKYDALIIDAKAEVEEMKSDAKKDIERAKEGLKPLILSDRLNDAAMIRAREISKKFAHERPNNTPFHTAIKKNPNFRMSGENIAAGSSTSEGTMNQWMNSQGHRENILNSDFTELGVGYFYAPNSTYKYYWVQLFRRPMY